MAGWKQRLVKPCLHFVYYDLTPDPEKVKKRYKIIRQRFEDSFLWKEGIEWHHAPARVGLSG